MTEEGRPATRVVVYYPSFAHWGGAEKQALLTAGALAVDHDVELCAEDVPSPADLADYFGIEFPPLTITPLNGGGPVIRRLLGSRHRVRRWQHALIRWSHGRQLAGRHADLLVSVEPSPPIACRAERGVYSCFFPFDGGGDELDRRISARAYHAACGLLERALLGDRKAARDTWSTIIANSHYTAGWIERWWQRQAHVVHPPCDDMGPPSTKEPWILSVGRFQAPTTSLPTKSFDVLINAFKTLHGRSDRPLELHLAGHCGDDPLSVAYLDDLRRLAAGLPVVFHVTIGRDELRDLYRRSSVFWLATGYGFDPGQHPAKQEHFGIVTVEAMSAGAVPVLRAAGGSVEIIGDLEIGGLWDSPEQLVDITLALLGDPHLLEAHSARAVQRAHDFSTEAFARRTREVVAGALRAPSPSRSEGAGVGRTRR